MTRAKEMRDLPLGLDVDSSGNVGIGMTPVALTGNHFVNSLSIGSNGPYILLKDENNANKMRYIANNTGEFQMGQVNDDGSTSKTEHLRITSDGKLGVGATTPQCKINIFGESTSNWADSDSMYGKDHPAFLKITNGQETVGVESGIVMRSKTSGAGVWSMYAKQTANYLADLHFRGRNAGTTSAVRLTLKSDGKVGIGTTSPLAQLEIDPPAVDTPIFAIRRQDSTTIPLFKFFQDSSVAQGTGHAHMNTGNRDLSITADTNSTKTLGIYLKTTGQVGIGTDSPLRNFSVIGSDTSSSGYKDIAEFLEPNTTGGTVSVNFGVANSLNNLGNVDFTYVGAGSTDNWVSLGFHSNDNKLKVYANGLVEVASYLKSKKGTIQTVVNQPTIYTSANPVNTWYEINSNFRVSITPRFSSGTMILGTYSIPINPTGAANILMAIQPWYSTNGGTTKTILNQGGPSGSRLSGSHAWFRSSNGYDANDMQNHVVHFGYTHSATTTLTWGFYFRSEGGNTTYFCQSNGNSSLWGWTAPCYMELREVEIA